MRLSAEGRLVDESKFPGDVVVTKGEWQKGRTINDVVDSLKEGDVIIKGANAINLDAKQAAILIGHPKAGTIGVSLPAVIGRRVKLFVAVGLEKRINGNLQVLAEKINAPGAGGYRLLPIPGQVFTELDAFAQLTGASAELIAAGGTCGAEGAIYLAVSGTREQEEAAEKLYAEVAVEPAFDSSYL
jgi:6-phosphogluconate dehydrogenase (decarboxylating)